MPMCLLLWNNLFYFPMELLFGQDLKDGGTKSRVPGIVCESMDHLLLHCCFVGLNGGWQVQDLEV